MEPWDDIEQRLHAATGADGELDRVLATAFDRPAAPLTASVEACRELVAAVLPGWRLHLGFGADGMFPYASLAGDSRRVVSDAPTVPLAILRSAVAAARAAGSVPSAPPPA